MKNLVQFINDIEDVYESRGTIKTYDPAGNAIDLPYAKWYVYEDTYRGCFKVNSYFDILCAGGCILSDVDDDFEEYGIGDILYVSDDLKDAIKYVLRMSADNVKNYEKMITDIENGMYDGKFPYGSYKSDELLDKYDVSFNELYGAEGFMFAVLTNSLNGESEEDFGGYVDIKPEQVNTFDKAKKIFKKEFGSSWGNI